MKKLPSETEEPLGSTEAGGYVVLHTWKSDYDKNQRIHQDQDQVKEIFSLQERKKNGWTFFAADAQVQGGMTHESVKSVEMISNFEIGVSLKFSKGARICYYVESATM